MYNKDDAACKVQDIIPLLPLQRTILFWGLAHPSSFQYYEQWRYTVTGEIHTELMRTAWEKTIEHFSILRGIFVWDKVRDPVFVVLKKQNAIFRVYDLQVNINNSRALSEDIARKEWQERVKLNINPIRLSVTLLSPNKCEWIISTNHILFDGWSNGLIMSYLVNCYNSLCKKQIVVIENDLLLYKKHLKQTLDEYNKQEHKQFWMEYLSDYIEYETNDLKYENSIRNCICSFPFPDYLLNMIDEFCVANNCSLSTYLYAAWAIKVSLHSNQRDIIIGATVSGRNNLLPYEMNNLTGLWIQTVPIRVNCENDTFIGDIISNIQNDLLLAEKHMYIHNHDWFGIFPNINTVYNQMLTIQNYPIDKSINKYTSIKIEFLSSNYQIISAFNVSIKAFDFMKCMEISYNAKMYNINQINKFATHFFNLLKYMSVMKSNQKLKNVFEEFYGCFDEIK